jgi:hypothetical protein
MKHCDVNNNAIGLCIFQKFSFFLSVNILEQSFLNSYTYCLKKENIVLYRWRHNYTSLNLFLKADRAQVKKSINNHEIIDSQLTVII